MRVPAVVVPALLVLAGAFFFVARPKDRPRSIEPVSFSNATPTLDLLDDEADRQFVAQLLQVPALSETQANSLVNAAGRRYIRRKQALAAAQQAVASGAAAPSSLEPLRQEMDLARKVCDLAESLGPRHPELASATQADWELERRAAFLPSSMTGLAEHHFGGATFAETDLAQMDKAFNTTFGHHIPVSSNGDSAVHRAMGFDHRGRFDLALGPSQPEGVWVRNYLTSRNVSFLAFGSAVPGRATGAHIHVGPPSTRRAAR